MFFLYVWASDEVPSYLLKSSVIFPRFLFQNVSKIKVFADSLKTAMLTYFYLSWRLENWSINALYIAQIPG